MIQKPLLHTIANEIGPDARFDVPLCEHTSFGIGGPADLFVETLSAVDLARALVASRSRGLDVLVLGGGTNLLVSDDGFEGIVIKPNNDTVSLSEDRSRVTAGASTRADQLVDQMVAAGLGGLEFAAGLPGSVGGAVAGNAGCFGSTFGDRILAATAVDGNGKIIQIDGPEAFGFDYRCSTVDREGWILVDVTLAVEATDPAALAAIAQGHKETRRTRHPARGAKTAGSYFKNLPPGPKGGHRRAAGALLEQVGAKEMSVGDAAVFEKHANILINRGSARAEDVLELASQMALRVKERFGLVLEPEVRFVGRK